MTVDIALLPSFLPASSITHQTVVVFDVLRATTTMTVALAGGAASITVFPDTTAAAQAKALDAEALLVGEVRCLPPPGFDLGNSPSVMAAFPVFGRRLFMSTTNGTKAIVAAQTASQTLIGALINAQAVARRAAQVGDDVLLLCAGSEGFPSLEDILGAGAVLHELRQTMDLRKVSDLALVAEQAFLQARADLPGLLRRGLGGRNILAAGLAPDIDFAARLNVFDVVGTARGLRPVVTAD